MKYERRRLSQPCGFLGPAAGRLSDHAGTASADGAFERGASRSFSGSAVVAILFTIPCLCFRDTNEFRVADHGQLPSCARLGRPGAAVPTRARARLVSTWMRLTLASLLLPGKS